MKLQLVSRESKYFFGMLTKREYAIRNQYGRFKDLENSPSCSDRYWIEDCSIIFSHCWSESENRVKNIFDKLTGQKPKYEYFIIEESE